MPVSEKMREVLNNIRLPLKRDLLVGDIVADLPLTFEEIALITHDRLTDQEKVMMLLNVLSTKDDSAVFALRDALASVEGSRHLSTTLHDLLQSKHIGQRRRANSVTDIGQLLLQGGLTSLPKNHVRRPALAKRLADALCEVWNHNEQYGDGGWVLVHGMAGSGKTTLTNEALRESDVHNLFTGGIIKLTMGASVDEATLLENMKQLYIFIIEKRRKMDYGLRLTERESSSMIVYETWISNVSLDALVTKVRMLLTDDRKSLPLIILDDVWPDKTSATPLWLKHFRLGTIVLITSRQKDILPEMITTNFQEVPVAVSSPEEALDVLAKSLQITRDLLPLTASRIVSEVGNNFMALSILASTLSDTHRSRGYDLKTRFNLVLDELQNGKRTGSNMDHIQKAIQLSVDSLGDIQDHFYDLCIFDASSSISAEVMSILWNCETEFAADEILCKFLNASLLQEEWSEGLNRCLYHIHSLVLKVLQADPEEVTRRHQKYIDCLKAKCNDQWHLLSVEDPYVWWTLGLHLHKAKQSEKIEELFSDVRFLNAKIRVTGVLDVINDLRRYDRNAEKAVCFKSIRRLIERNGDRLNQLGYRNVLDYSAAHQPVPGSPVREHESFSNRSRRKSCDFTVGEVPKAKLELTLSDKFSFPGIQSSIVASTMHSRPYDSANLNEPWWELVQLGLCDEKLCELVMEKLTPGARQNIRHTFYWLWLNSVDTICTDEAICSWSQTVVNSLPKHSNGGDNVDSTTSASNTSLITAIYETKKIVYVAERNGVVHCIRHACSSPEMPSSLSESGMKDTHRTFQIKEEIIGCCVDKQTGRLFLATPKKLMVYNIHNILKDFEASISEFPIHDTPQKVCETDLDKNDQLTCFCLADSSIYMGFQSGAFKSVHIFSDGKIPGQPYDVSLFCRKTNQPVVVGGAITLLSIYDYDKDSDLCAIISKDGNIHLAKLSLGDIIASRKLFDLFSTARDICEELPSCVAFFYRETETIADFNEENVMLAIPLPGRPAIGIFDYQLNHMDTLEVQTSGDPTIHSLHVCGIDSVEFLLAASTTEHYIVVWRFDPNRHFPPIGVSNHPPAHPPVSAIIQTRGEPSAIFLMNNPYVTHTIARNRDHNISQNAPHSILCITTDGVVAEYLLINHRIILRNQDNVRHMLNSYNSHQKNKEPAISQPEDSPIFAIGENVDECDNVAALNYLSLNDPLNTFGSLQGVNPLCEEGHIHINGHGDKIDCPADSQPLSSDELSMNSNILIYNLESLKVGNSNAFQEGYLRAHLLVCQNTRTADIEFFIIRAHNFSDSGVTSKGSTLNSPMRICYKFHFSRCYSSSDPQYRISHFAIHPQGHWLAAVVGEQHIILIFSLSWSFSSNGLINLSIDPKLSKLVALNRSVAEIMSSSSSRCSLNWAQHVSSIVICPHVKSGVMSQSDLIVGMSSGELRRIQVEEDKLSLKFGGDIKCFNQSDMVIPLGPVSHLFYVPRDQMDRRNRQFIHPTVSSPQQVKSSSRLDTVDASLSSLSLHDNDFYIVAVWNERKVGAVFTCDTISVHQTTLHSQKITDCHVGGEKNETFLNHRSFLVTASMDKTVKFWSLPDLQPLVIVDHTNAPQVCRSVLLPNNKWNNSAQAVNLMLVTSDEFGEVTLWHVYSPSRQQGTDAEFDVIRGRRVPRKSSNIPLRYRALASINSLSSAKTSPVKWLSSNINGESTNSSKKDLPICDILTFSPVQMRDNSVYFVLPCQSNQTLFYTFKITMTPNETGPSLSVPSNTHGDAVSPVNVTLANKFYLPNSSNAVAKTVWLSSALQGGAMKNMLLVLNTKGGAYLLEMFNP